MATGRHTAPAAPRRRSKAPLIIFIVIILAVAAGALFFMLHERPGEVAVGEEIIVEIPVGTPAKDVGPILKDAHVIALVRDFDSVVAERNAADQIKAGTYLFIGGQSIEEIVDTLIAGSTGYNLVIPEGLNASQIAAKVHDACGVDADEFWALTQQASNYVGAFPFLEGVYNNSLEGYLFPDTYAVPYGSSADDVIRMMLQNFADKIAQVDMTAAQEKNLDAADIVTLASIIQLESGSLDDMAGISSVFYNRMHEGMNLGSDVTTYYAVGKDMSEPLTVDDLASDSPYNTRNPEVKGLPAGPICCPGLAALEAAAHPADTANLYFFWSNSQNVTMFFEDSRSFDAAWAEYGD